MRLVSHLFLAITPQHPGREAQSAPAVANGGLQGCRRGFRVNNLSQDQRMDEIRMGLKRELYGQRGVLCRVIEGSRIQRGDTIQVTAAIAGPTIGGEL